MGFLFAVNMATTNSALLYISYPVQVIGRNIRFLCVVVVGAFFSRVSSKHTHLRLGKHKIFIATIITIGVLLFNFAKVLILRLREKRIRVINMTLSMNGLDTCF